MNFIKASLGIIPLLLPLTEATAAPLSFDQALNQIMERSTTTTSQEADLNATIARNLPTRLSFLPSLAVTGKQTTSGASDTDSTTQQIEVNTELNLFRFGADYFALKAASSDEDTQRAALDASYLSAEDEAIRSLVTEIQRKKEIEIAVQFVKLEEESYRIAQQRYDRGLLALQEVEKISIDLDNAKARLADAELRESTERATLTALLGHADIQMDWPWLERLKTNAFTSLLDESAYNPAHRPEWRTAKAQVDAESYRLDRYRRLIFPSLDAGFTYGYYTAPGQTGATAWSGAFTLTIPLFDRLTNYSTARAQNYAHVKSEITLERVQRNTRTEWMNARQSFQTSLKAAIARDKILATSRKLYDDNLKRFQQGRISSNDLFVDQNRLFDSESFTVQSWSTAHIAFAKLCHALGRRVSDCK